MAQARIASFAFSLLLVGAVHAQGVTGRAGGSGQWPWPLPSGINHASDLDWRHPAGAA